MQCISLDSSRYSPHSVDNAEEEDRIKVIEKMIVSEVPNSISDITKTNAGTGTFKDIFGSTFDTYDGSSFESIPEKFNQEMSSASLFETA